MKREICLLTVIAAGVVAMGAQDTPAPPPVKMGLWQNTTTNTMSGMQIPPEVAARMQAMGRPVPGAPRTTVTQSCLTPDRWQKSVSQMQQNSNCQFTNVKQSASGMSGDVTCTTGDGASKGHLDVTYSGAEKMSGKMHMDVTSSRAPQPITMDITFESVYQGADCKGISPDLPKVIH
jgi:hypothetical protein